MSKQSVSSNPGQLVVSILLPVNTKKYDTFTMFMYMEEVHYANVTVARKTKAFIHIKRV